MITCASVVFMLQQYIIYLGMTMINQVQYYEKGMCEVEVIKIKH